METESPKKRPSSAWTEEETRHLINAYSEICESLGRTQLKSSQWEQVSVTVAARSGHSDPNAGKSAIQCRHKMEKLRQRFRSLNSRPSPAPWPFFAAMSRLFQEEPHGSFAAEITDFATRMAALERTKIEAVREIEMRWLEMENQRIQMIARSESDIVDSIARVFGGSLT